MHDLVVDEILEEEDTEFGTTTYLTCPYCGMEEVRWDTAENEKKDYPYWQEEEK